MPSVEVVAVVSLPRNTCRGAEVREVTRGSGSQVLVVANRWMRHIQHPPPCRVVRGVVLGQRSILVLGVPEGHDRDVPSRNEEIGDGRVMAKRRGDGLAWLARDVASCCDDERARPLLPAAPSVEAPVVPHPPEDDVLPTFPEEAVVSPVPGQAVVATSAVEAGHFPAPPQSG